MYVDQYEIKKRYFARRVSVAVEALHMLKDTLG